MKVLSQLSKLSPLEIFAVVFGSIVVAISGTVIVRSASAALLHSLPKIPTFGWVTRFLRWLARFLRRCRYQPILRRRTCIGPWSSSSVLALLSYIAINLTLVFIPPGSVEIACSRSGILASLNLVPLLFLLHHAVGADLFKVSLPTVRRAHRAFAIVTTLMVAVHIVCWFQIRSGFSWSNRSDLNAVVAASVLALIWLTSHGIVRRRYYELFLRFHQILSAAVAYGTWMHTAGRSSFVNYIRIAGAILVGTFLASQLLRVLWVHRLFYYGWPRADVCMGLEHVVISLSLPFNVTIDPGQYINIWIPGMGIRSVFQTHPFMVAEIHPQKNTQMITLLIERGRGWSHRLSLFAERRSNTKRYRVLFTGPHGNPVHLHDYGTVIMVASGFGFVAHLPYLQHLLECHHQGTALARRVHLIWCLECINDGSGFEESLNALLDQDTTHSILRVSIYYTSGEIDLNSQRWGSLDRVQLVRQSPDWKHVISSAAHDQSGPIASNITTMSPRLSTESSRKPAQSTNMSAEGAQLTEKSAHNHSMLKNAAKTASLTFGHGENFGLVGLHSAFRDLYRRTILTVSANPTVRDDVRDAVAHTGGVELVELDFQPL